MDLCPFSFLCLLISRYFMMILISTLLLDLFSCKFTVFESV
uniref:Uncharacterized protein n=1 Tax=Arundo donax TaxID=35708 RepID=A0A0A9D3C9_ARUDO